VAADHDQAAASPSRLARNAIHEGDARTLLADIEPESIALSVWSPPYHVGKSYERGESFDDWQSLIGDVLAAHLPILRPGGFVVVNIADILAFPDATLPRVQADVVTGKRCAVTVEAVEATQAANPEATRYELAALLGVSEQTIDRRLNGNNARGGKHAPQTRVLLTAGIVEQLALDAGLHLYDRRVWLKDPAWANSRWTSTSYRAVDEIEHVLIFWKPGVTKVDRTRLAPSEWGAWGSRAAWSISSVRRNDVHEAMFPVELPRRLIRLLTEPGETVLDPFIGSGTTAVAAAEAGRDFIGIDIDPRAIAVAQQRVFEAQEEAA
jgi:DNA modification methylase